MNFISLSGGADLRFFFNQTLSCLLVLFTLQDHGSSNDANSHTSQRKDEAQFRNNVGQCIDLNAFLFTAFLFPGNGTKHFTTTVCNSKTKYQLQINAK